MALLRLCFEASAVSNVCLCVYSCGSKSSLVRSFVSVTEFICRVLT
ncbi:hypothetical protein KC19_2G147000 [Ceratodon purpureus]|uniref:Uncharacterized protein n=1 Tax=Ceratodon purpureus TaxID=3225 RepID=A0A8T0IWY6_CERPU|nr:hypothetical protein KC19_2G147000 [Ceratodon purpureus]